MASLDLPRQQSKHKVHTNAHWELDGPCLTHMHASATAKPSGEDMPRRVRGCRHVL